MVEGTFVLHLEKSPFIFSDHLFVAVDEEYCCLLLIELQNQPAALICV